MLVEIRRILIPTDFSEPARQALHYAMALAERFDCELHLFHIVPRVVIPIPESSTSWTLPAGEQRLQIKEAESRLLQEIDSKWAAAHRATQVAKVGDPVEDIVQYAKDEEIDLIVIGTHGHTGLARLMLGSVAEKVVRMATCPVLTVHPKGHQFVTESETSSSLSASK